jgi:hypothetical protein
LTKISHNFFYSHEGALFDEENNSKYIIGVLSASGSKCRSHVPTLFAFVPSKVAWMRSYLEEYEKEKGNESILMRLIHAEGHPRISFIAN